MDELAHRSRVRALAILALMFALMMQLGFLFAYAAGPQNAVGIIVFVLFISLLVDVRIYYASDKLALKLGAELVSREQEPVLHELVDELVIATGLPRPQVAVVPDDSLNAFATGRDPQHALVAVNRGLLRALDRNELRAILAHEFSHIYNRDMLVSTIGNIALRTVARTADAFIIVGLAMLTMQSGGRRTKQQRDAENGGRAMGAALALFGFTLAITLVPALFLLQMALGRSRESLADITAVHFTQDPDALARALAKLEADPTPSPLADTAAAALCVRRPAGGRSSLFSWWQRVNSTHPATEERIKIVRKLELGQGFTYATATAGQTYFGVGAMLVAAGALLVVPSYALGQQANCRYVDCSYTSDFIEPDFVDPLVEEPMWTPEPQFTDEPTYPIYPENTEEIPADQTDVPLDPTDDPLYVSESLSATAPSDLSGGIGEGSTEEPPAPSPSGSDVSGGVG